MLAAAGDKPAATVGRSSPAAARRSQAILAALRPTRSNRCSAMGLSHAVPSCATSCARLHTGEEGGRREQAGQRRVAACSWMCGRIATSGLAPLLPAPPPAAH